MFKIDLKNLQTLKNIYFYKYFNIFVGSSHQLKISRFIHVFFYQKKEKLTFEDWIQTQLNWNSLGYFVSTNDQIFWSNSWRCHRKRRCNSSHFIDNRISVRQVDFILESYLAVMTYDLINLVLHFALHLGVKYHVEKHWR